MRAKITQIARSYLVVADPCHLHVVREGRLRPGDGRAVPADDLDILRAVLDFRRCAACGEHADLANRSITATVAFLLLSRSERVRARKTPSVRIDDNDGGVSIPVPSDESATRFRSIREIAKRRNSLSRSCPPPRVREEPPAGTN